MIAGCQIHVHITAASAASQSRLRFS